MYTYKSTKFSLTGSESDSGNRRLINSTLDGAKVTFSFSGEKNRPRVIVDRKVTAEECETLGLVLERVYSYSNKGSAIGSDGRLDQLKQVLGDAFVSASLEDGDIEIVVASNLLTSAQTTIAKLELVGE